MYETSKAELKGIDIFGFCSILRLSSWSTPKFYRLGISCHYFTQTEKLTHLESWR